jgi:magnesium-transporting ATPase (P-type)
MIGALVGAAAFIAFLIGREGDGNAAQTMAFTTVALAELALVFAVRSPIHAAFPAPPNRYLLGSVLLSVAVVLGAVYLPFLNDPLGTVPLDSDELLVAVLLALVPFLCVEAGKALARRAGWRLDGVPE